VINKVDRRDAEPSRVLNQTFDLFIELGASDDQTDFPVIYTNAITAQAGLTPKLGPDLQPLFQASCATFRRRWWMWTLTPRCW
jgi:GTP-binding protein